MKSFRILVVEDNQDLLELIVKYLELCGWRALAANNQEDFWLQLERQRPNLILLDVTIQGSEASSLLKRAQERFAVHRYSGDSHGGDGLNSGEKSLYRCRM